MTTIKLIISGLLACLAVYLFVSAPPALNHTSQNLDQTTTYDVIETFKAVDIINAVSRQIYTSRIVGAGKNNGLRYSEEWANTDVESGPLPALFLRLVAKRLEAKPTKISLFLGSEFPINASNLFSAEQLIQFQKLKESNKSIFFETNDGTQIAMTPDIASAVPCVDCHNEHKDSPYTKWKMDDIMGATTWVYPQKNLTAQEYLQAITSVFEAVEESYSLYLTKTQTFSTPPHIVPRWPEKHEYALPDAATFINTLHKECADKLAGIMFEKKTPKKNENDDD